MEKLDKKTYRGIVKFTLESMLNLSKTDKNYNLAADTIYYYENTIVMAFWDTKKTCLCRISSNGSVLRSRGYYSRRFV